MYGGGKTSGGGKSPRSTMNVKGVGRVPIVGVRRARTSKTKGGFPTPNLITKYPGKVSKGRGRVSR